MNIEERIEIALLNYLKAEHDIDALSAHLDSTASADSYSGCDTCGYGGSEMSFDIIYKLKGEKWNKTLTINGDPLWFLPTLFKYDELG